MQRTLFQRRFEANFTCNMSFNGFRTTVEEGDTVVLFLTVTQIYTVKAERKTISKRGTLVDNVFQTPHGALRCADLIGCQFGSKVSLSKGWGYILQPTPELWTVTLPHRTQILYTPDVSMVVLQLELHPGSIVIESGTGSGSLSHALIRAIKPHGHLYTFDFHKVRVDIVTEEFRSHGYGDYVTVQQRDVCSDGFGEELTGKADAVFLDLPHPWLALPHALACLKPTGGRVCSFSPCIEQVQKSCALFAKLGCQELQTLEVLQTQYNVQTKTVPVLEFEFVKTEKGGDEADGKRKVREVVKTVTAVPPPSLPGHTGYLTFATLPPVWARTVPSVGCDSEEECESP